jgi:hypothetical protein
MASYRGAPSYFLGKKKTAPDQSLPQLQNELRNGWPKKKALLRMSGKENQTKEMGAVCKRTRSKKTESSVKGPTKVKIFLKKPAKILLILLAMAVILFPPDTTLPLSPNEAPDPSKMVREPIWGGDFRIILCFEGGQYYMYRMEKLPFQFSVHGSGWQEYVKKTSVK